MKQKKTTDICLLCLHQTEFWGLKVNNYTLGAAEHAPPPKSHAHFQMAYLVSLLFPVILGPYSKIIFP